MEYVILTSGLVAIAAAWDVARRFLSSNAHQALVAREISGHRKRLSDIEEHLEQVARDVPPLLLRVKLLEDGTLATRNHVTELKSFLSAQRKGR